MEEMTGLEQIIYCISELVDDALKQCEEELLPESCDDLIECRELCDKLINHDYFEKSEKLLNKSVDKGKLQHYTDFSKVAKKWERLQKKELNERNKDLSRLFNLIVANSEEI